MHVDTQTHLHTLRDLLTYRLNDLRAEVHAAEMARREGGTSSAEVHDRKEEAEQRRVEATLGAEESRDFAELKRVEAALQRLDSGTYGDCADCGEPISLQRLLSQPAAECCVACQARREHRAGQVAV